MSTKPEELVKVEQNVAAINDGRRAKIGYEALLPTFALQREVLLTRIIQDFNTGGPDLGTKLLIHAAGLSALSVQEIELKAKITKGNRAWEERDKNGT
jgi:hypothetical protein